MELLKELLEPPSVVILTQKAQAGEGKSWQIGKTNTSLWIGETLKQLGFISKIGWNIKSLDGRTDFIDNVGTLEEWGGQDRTRKLFIWDDSLRSMIYSETMGGLAKQIIKLGPMLTQYNMTLEIVIHDMDLALKKLIRSKAFIRGTIKKLSRTSLSIQTQGRSYYFGQIPPTSIKYDRMLKGEFGLTGHSGPFLDRRDYQAYEMWTQGRNYTEIKQALGIVHDEDIKRGNRRVARALIALMRSNNQTPQLRGLLIDMEKLEQTHT